MGELMVALMSGFMDVFNRIQCKHKRDSGSCHYAVKRSFNLVYQMREIAVVVMQALLICLFKMEQVTFRI